MAGLSETISMLSVSTKTWPSQRATPRFATWPKSLKTATSLGDQRHFTWPVVALRAQTLSLLVVMYSVPFDSTGYDCSPCRTVGSMLWKSTVKRRPRLLDVAGVDLGERRVAVLVRRVAKAAPTDVGGGLRALGDRLRDRQPGTQTELRKGVPPAQRSLRTRFRPRALTRRPSISRPSISSTRVYIGGPGPRG